MTSRTAQQRLNSNYITAHASLHFQGFLLGKERGLPRLQLKSLFQTELMKLPLASTQALTLILNVKAVIFVWKVVVFK